MQKKLWICIIFLAFYDFSKGQDNLKDSLVNQYLDECIAQIKGLAPSLSDTTASGNAFQVYAIQYYKDWVLLITDSTGYYSYRKFHKVDSLVQNSVFFDNNFCQLISKKMIVKNKKAKVFAIMDIEFTNGYYEFTKEGQKFYEYFTGFESGKRPAGLFKKIGGGIADMFKNKKLEEQKKLLEAQKKKLEDIKKQKDALEKKLGEIAELQKTIKSLESEIQKLQKKQPRSEDLPENKENTQAVTQDSVQTMPAEKIKPDSTSTLNHNPIKKKSIKSIENQAEVQKDSLQNLNTPSKDSIQQIISKKSPLDVKKDSLENERKRREKLLNQKYNNQTQDTKGIQNVKLKQLYEDKDRLRQEIKSLENSLEKSTNKAEYIQLKNDKMLKEKELQLTFDKIKEILALEKEGIK